MTPSHLGPCHEEVPEGITPKRRHSGVTKHHYCLCFCRQTTIILENLKIEEEAKHSQCTELI